MREYLCISVRFLDGEFHGRAEGGEPEWPPSPLRLFQALTAAAAARWNERRKITHATPALCWLERLPPPMIIAPAIAAGAAYKLYVPDNVGDLLGKAWSRGSDASLADYRAEKMVAPSRLQPGGGVHYLWPLESTDITPHREIIETATRSITHLGWGVDLVVAEASVIQEIDSRRLPGERWIAMGNGAGTRLRVPCAGTLEALAHRHHQFLQRMQGDRFSPVSPLAVFDLAAYLRENEQPPPACALFALRSLDGATFQSFDPARKGLIVAGMLRHAASGKGVATAVGWSDEQVNQVVLGHAEARGDLHAPVEGPRIMFLPLPSVESRGPQAPMAIGNVRRVLLVARGDLPASEFRAFTQRLAGRELIDEESGKPIAVLARLGEGDSVAQHYTRTAATWATVTPVILPGYDDPRKLRQRLRLKAETTLSAKEKADLLSKLDRRIDLLLRKAIRQAGFSDELAGFADLDWRAPGFWPGTELASGYSVPQQHRRYRRLHVKITWRDQRGNLVNVRGPVCLGGGKFSGMGLFAAVPNP